MSVLHAFLSYLHPPEPGQDASLPLQVKAVPGLMTLLDTALFQSVEGEITSTVCASHALLNAFLDLKRQAQSTLQALHRTEHGSVSTVAGTASGSSASATMGAYASAYAEDAETVVPKACVVAESFARACLEAASDAVERLSTERLAQTANLTDPYDSVSSGSSGSGSSSTIYSSAASSVSGVGVQGITTGVLTGKEDTGRRIPWQRPEDCWESPRLFCPDHVWADDSFSACQRLLRNLTRHPFMSDSDPALLSGLTSAGSGGGHSLGFGSVRLQLSQAAERNSAILIQLVQEDLPVRLYQFRAATEADVVVTKRLYLVKCEYRAPFRAFLEGHQSVLRAPSVQVVDKYISLSNDPASDDDDAKNEARQKLQSLLESRELLELLELEKMCEETEIAMSNALFPFSEMARVLDHKRARLKAVNGIVDPSELPSLHETLRRLKYILCRKSGPETSTGIRPLLLDLQGMPRDDEMAAPGGGGDDDDDTFSSVLMAIRSPYTHTDPFRTDTRTVERRLDVLLGQLRTMVRLCKVRHAFKTDRKSDTDILPSTVVKGCAGFDEEQFRCHFLDWRDMVKRQAEIQASTMGDGDGTGSDKPKLASLAEQIRKAELEVGIAAATDQALGMVRKRLEQIATDRQKRFEVLKEMVEDVCLREMGLHVDLQAPDAEETLRLKPTSALGFLGLPLQMRGERLPVG